MLSFAGQGSILVVGDVMLDRYVHGRASRLSPEAPVPVLRWAREQQVAGGAANVAANIAALGGAVTVAGVVGADRHGADLKSALDGFGPNLTPVFIEDAGRPTTVKTRMVSNGQQMLRVDHEDTREIDAATEAALLAAVDPFIAATRVVVLSDYRKGALTMRVIRHLIERSRTLGRPVVVDPKRSDWDVYQGATLITPNRMELEAATGRPASTDAEVADAARVAIARTGAAILVTRSERGMSLIDGDAVFHLPAHAQEVFDVSGAGDTAVAVLASGMAAGMSLREAMRTANVAAGLAVTKHGTATLTIDELNRALHDWAAPKQRPGFVDQAEAVRLRDLWAQEGLRVGFTNGCFDIIHPGHIRLLEQAAARCDRLIVGLNTDASVRRLKGEARPVQNETSRATVLAALSAVDAVVLFEEDTPLSLIHALRPDLLVKGADYAPSEVVGANFVQSHGGTLFLVPLEDGQSTTSIIDRSRTPTRKD